MVSSIKFSDLANSIIRESSASQFTGIESITILFSREKFRRESDGKSSVSGFGCSVDTGERIPSEQERRRCEVKNICGLRGEGAYIVPRVYDGFVSVTVRSFFRSHCGSRSR